MDACEGLVLHCDRCGMPCYPPTYEQIEQFERQDPSARNATVGLVCKECRQKEREGK